MFEADGTTYHYKAFGPPGEGFFAAHSPCIEAVKATGATFVIWCPGLMKSGQRSTPPPKTLLYADPAGLAAWDFVSYRASARCRALLAGGIKHQALTRSPAHCAEDAAQVLVSAAETTEFDNKHISALSPPAPAKSEL